MLCAGNCWNDKAPQNIMGKSCHYKHFWKGYKSGHEDVGILIKEKWSASVLYLELTLVL